MKDRNWSNVWRVVDPEIRSHLPPLPPTATEPALHCCGSIVGSRASNFPPPIFHQPPVSCAPWSAMPLSAPQTPLGQSTRPNRLHIICKESNEPLLSVNRSRPTPLRSWRCGLFWRRCLCDCLEARWETSNAAWRNTVRRLSLLQFTVSGFHEF